MTGSRWLRAGTILMAIWLGLALAVPGRPRAVAAPVPAQVIGQGPTNAPIIALVFDGGPGSETAGIVAELHALYVPATFFFSGIAASLQPSVVRTVSTSWNEIGSATYSYTDLQSLSTPQVVSEIARGQSAIRAITGQTPTWFLAPYGDIDARIAGIASSLRLRPVIWSVNAANLVHSPVATIVRSVTSRAVNGSIVVFHEQGAPAAVTLSALKRSVDALKSRGFRFATLDELIGLRGLPSCAPNPAGQFSAAGIKLVRGPIYDFWLSHLCRGIVFGPATSSPRAGKHGEVVEDFARTGRRLALSPATRTVRVILMWPWGAKIFSGEKIKPKYGHPITRAWFAQYFAGTSRGAALTPEHVVNGLTVQQFQDGWAVESAEGRVSWRKTLDGSG